MAQRALCGSSNPVDELGIRSFVVRSGRVATTSSAIRALYYFFPALAIAVAPKGPKTQCFWNRTRVATHPQTRRSYIAIGNYVFLRGLGRSTAFRSRKNSCTKCGTSHSRVTEDKAGMSGTPVGRASRVSHV